MDVTLLLHKPVAYGSDLANALFIALLCAHALPAAAAPVAGVVAMFAKKGSRKHILAGKIFLWAMVITASSGIVVDAIRLGIAFQANHTTYVGAAMPSSIPARLGFMFVGCCVLYLAYEATNRHVFRRQSLPNTLGSMLIPGALVVMGVGLAFVVITRLNPWTGALWMNITFVPIVIATAALRRRQSTDAGAGVAKHRFAMLSLFAFSLWGALQGFGPAIAIRLVKVPEESSGYTGATPGPFSPAFFFFLIGWAPSYLLGAYLVRRFARRRAALIAGRAEPV